mgnify:CR=1 FL=1
MGGQAASRPAAGDPGAQRAGLPALPTLPTLGQFGTLWRGALTLAVPPMMAHPDVAMAAFKVCNCLGREDRENNNKN